MTLKVKRSFSIQNFVSQVRETGLAKPIHFEIDFSLPPCIKTYANALETVCLLCKNASLPQTRINTSRMQFSGPPVYRPVGVDYGGDNLTLTFYVDGKMRVKGFFDEWVDGIVDRRSGNLYSSEFYLSFLNVKQLNVGGYVEYVASFEDLYPVTVNPLILDYGSTGQVHELSVTFNYRRWSYELSDASLQPDVKAQPKASNEKSPVDDPLKNNGQQRKKPRNRNGTISSQIYKRT